MNNFKSRARTRKSCSQCKLNLTDHLSQGCHIPGIFVLRPRAEIGAIIDNLIFIALAAE